MSVSTAVPAARLDPTAPFLRRTWMRAQDMFSDRSYQTVLLIWALCWLSNAIFLTKYSSPLPWADEWELTPAAVGQTPLTWQWLWASQGEHRTPLTRLEVLLLGRLANWDLRLVHHINLTFFAVGSLALILAVRAVRGRTALSDAFLCLLVFTPWQYETIVVYAYAYSMALGLFCLAIGAVMAGWPLRSVPAVWVYFSLALAVTLAGGPAGNLWAIGLCGALVRGWLEKPTRSWKINAAAGTALVVVASAGMLLSIPPTQHHLGYYSDSLRTLFGATARLMVVWLGLPLQTLWPWAFLVVAVPSVYVLGRVVRDIWQVGRARTLAAADLGKWVDLGMVFFAVAGVGVMIAYGRGRSESLLHSRYCALMLPIGIILYLLLVRLRAPLILSGALIVVMAVSVGWNWPLVIGFCQAWHQGRVEAVNLVRQGQTPLAEVAHVYGRGLGYEYDANRLLYLMTLLREAKLSVFHPKFQKESVPGMGRSLAWEAETGQLKSGLRPVYDITATGAVAVEAIAPSQVPAVATYVIDVPAAGEYELCCRVLVPEHWSYLSVQVGDGPAVKRYLPKWPEYYTYYHGPHEPILLALSAGKHTLTITLDQPGTRLDLLELIPRRPDRRGEELIAGP